MFWIFFKCQTDLYKNSQTNAKQKTGLPSWLYLVKETASEVIMNNMNLKVENKKNGENQTRRLKEFMHLLEQSAADAHLFQKYI
jgi:hypothetical protein